MITLCSASHLSPYTVLFHSSSPLSLEPWNLSHFTYVYHTKYKLEMHWESRLHRDDGAIYSYTQHSLAGVQLTTSFSPNHRAISFWADSTPSDPCRMLRPTCTHRSPRMVPGAESAGLVAPRIWRPVFTAFRPSHTIGTTGPLLMYLTRPGKNGRADRSA